MQADWEFEVGEGAPIIDALWPGFVDLRRAPERARSLSETTGFPPLATALEKLNAPPSPVWTVKCDWWPALDPAAIGLDRYELDAPPESMAHAAGCYIDLLPSAGGAWSAQKPAEDAARNLCAVMDRVAVSCCRIDLIVRRAVIAAGRIDLGITAYVTACGSSPAEAHKTLARALAAFTDVAANDSTLK
jgi:hypothetical protein